MKRNTQWLVRLLAGGIIGLAVLLPLGGVFNDLVSGGLIAMGPHTPFRLVSADLERLTGSAPLALAIQLVLYFSLGAVVGVSTLPFADDGPALVRRSLAHFAATAALLSLTTWLLGWAWNWQALRVYLVLLLAVYLLIWLGRWVGWYVEVAAIRENLGLAPGPSPLRWRETLPYIPFALGLCVALPLVLWIFDAVDVPVLRALLFPYLLLPVGCFFSALSLGRRQGFCPLYPLVCALATLAAVYLLIWLGRWVGWYAELSAIREKLGLAPGPSPLRWRETLPYLPFAALMCLLLPLALRWFLDSPIPLATAVYACLALPVGGFFSGLSLGRRQGFCPVYPLACALFALGFVLLAKLTSNVADGVMIPIALCSTLLGNAAGAVVRRGRKEAL